MFFTILKEKADRRSSECIELPVHAPSGEERTDHPERTLNRWDKDRSERQPIHVRLAGTLNYHLAGLLDTIDALYTKYNAFLRENGYGPKYDLGEARMFVIEGMEKVRRVIEENRKRKLTKHKKISNNTILEIDNCSPLEILKLQRNLTQIAQG